MATITWGDPGERTYEAGTDRGVLYIDDTGVAWNGLIGVSEKPAGGEATPYYIDGVKYMDRRGVEEFHATIEAFTYPDEFAYCDGSADIAAGVMVTQQEHKPFGLTYRTRLGNDVDGLDHGYKIHIIYNAMASPADRDYKSLGDRTDPLSFSWDLTTRKEKFQDPSFGIKVASHVVIDSRTTYPPALAAIEAKLYGTDTDLPALPTPTELINIFIDNAQFKVIDNQDGSVTVDGPDTAVIYVSDTEYQLSWPSVVQLDATTYQISSL